MSRANGRQQGSERRQRIGVVLGCGVGNWYRCCERLENENFSRGVDNRLDGW